MSSAVMHMDYDLYADDSQLLIFSELEQGQALVDGAVAMV